MLTATRQTARPTLSTALALFVVVWLNMALAPCLMAQEIGAETTVPCPHCPPADDPPCHEPAPTRCGYIDDYDHDGRIALAEDTPRVAWFVVDDLPEPAAGPPLRAGVPAPDARATEPPQPPSRHRYCVYLI